MRFSLTTIAFDRESAQMSQILPSQGKNAPSNPYPHYLVRLATSRHLKPEGQLHPLRKWSSCDPWLMVDCLGKDRLWWECLRAKRHTRACSTIVSPTGADRLSLLKRGQGLELFWVDVIKCLIDSSWQLAQCCSFTPPFHQHIGNTPLTLSFSLGLSKLSYTPRSKQHCLHKHC